MLVIPLDDDVRKERYEQRIACFGFNLFAAEDSLDEESPYNERCNRETNEWTDESVSGERRVRDRRSSHRHEQNESQDK